ncbi:MAG: hypothetical protein M3Q56_12580 [Bacteroidota bacterium]|nr:hypothetical protein [Bacteroidota bacterium]
MNFWKYITGDRDTSEPDIVFGRFSDAYKSREKYASWDQSMEAFEKEDYKTSVKHMLDYLRNEKGNNIKWHEKGENLEFSFYQGSKVIVGVVDTNCFRAEASIAKATEMNIGFLRLACEDSYELKYSRFALTPDNILCLIFDSYIEEASPYKIYYGLKEIALRADKNDDVLIQEFRSLVPIQIDHIIALPDSEKAVKFKFYKHWIQESLDPKAIGALNADRFPGAFTYIFLSTFYKIDYLIKPEGTIAETLEGLHDEYFEEAEFETSMKVKKLRVGLELMDLFTKEQFYQSLYKINSTFGQVNPTNHAAVTSIILNEFKSIDWYLENKHDKVCKAICDYICGYCLFHFALPAPDKDLFHFYYQFTESDYFTALGFESNHRSPNQNLEYDLIVDHVNELLEKHSSVFKEISLQFVPDTNSEVRFLISYMRFITSLKLG